MSFPAQPARDAVARFADRHGVPISEVAGPLGVSRSTLQRLYTRDWLRSDAADRMAVALGCHPYELWPDWFPACPSARSAAAPHRAAAVAAGRVHGAGAGAGRGHGARRRRGVPTRRAGVDASAGAAGDARVTVDAPVPEPGSVRRGEPGPGPGRLR